MENVSLFTVSHILKMPLTVWPQKSHPNSVGRTKQIVFALIGKMHPSFIYESEIH